MPERRLQGIARRLETRTVIIEKNIVRENKQTAHIWPHNGRATKTAKTRRICAKAQEEERNNVPYAARKHMVGWTSDAL